MITAAFLICLAPIPLDGDTLRCGNTKTTVRLFGVRSVDKTAEDQAAKAMLVPLTAGGLLCEPKGTSYSRVVAVCYNFEGNDIGKTLIIERKVTEWCEYSKNYYGTCY